MGGTRRPDGPFGSYVDLPTSSHKICLCFVSISAICGAAIVYGITPSQSVGSLGVTAPANDVTTAQAFVTELVLTYILLFAIFAVTDPSRGMTGYGVPLAIGITVFICLMHGVSTKYLNR